MCCGELSIESSVSAHLLVQHVKAVLENDSLLITFDGWSSKYDFVCPMDSTDIAPCGTTAALGKVLQGPKRRDISQSFKEDAQSWFDWREWLGDVCISILLPLVFERPKMVKCAGLDE